MYQMTSISMACAAFVSVVTLTALPVCAQTVPTKPGLWASASEVILNGKKLPTLFDIKGVPEAKKAQLRQQMSAAGLPAGWNPSMTCEKASQVDLQKIFTDLKDQGCTAAITSRTSDHITAKFQCKADAGAASGTADVSGVSSASVTYAINLTGIMYGKPMTYKATTISKLVGSDCAVPAGADAGMAGN